ncbi:MAG: formylmethanofuran dehydrogenase subunit C [Candidatus Syntrophoarchaeum sp.]|nr:formylmethanofuran dehydrogenase subunit C [Methanomicrobia archaeon]MBL7117908.1 formylmethanofuran dehydrogenase subunit C [Candidatus Syntrophoarchaeum sp.]
MQTIRLKLKEEVMSGNARIPVEVDSLTPDKLVGKNEAEIKAVKVWWGNKEENTGELFDVRVEGEAGSAEEVKIVMEGDLSRVKHIGDGMKAGEIEAIGDVDMHCGAMMTGGKITVKGNADCWAGREMKGGELIIEGDAGANLCAMYRGEMTGMTGGKVTVGGNAGECAGQYMAGGEILIKGNAELLAGLNMHGGKITIEGDAVMPGADMTSGEIAVKGKVQDMMPSFKFAEAATIEGEEYKKYIGDLAMTEKKAKGVLYVK